MHRFRAVEQRIDASTRGSYLDQQRLPSEDPGQGTATMQIKEILAALAYYTGEFPREALARAIEERERIVPELLDIIKRAADNPQELEDEPDYMGHIYAMFLLSQFREQRAYEPIVRFFAQPGDLSLDLTGDVVTEDLDSMLASVSCGDETLIKALIENPEANEYVRGSALRSLVALVLTGELTRESVVGYFATLFREKLPREPSHVWDCLVACSVDFYPEDLYMDIERCFRDELVDTFFVNPRDIHATLDKGKERTLGRLREDRTYRLIEDTIAEMEWWACFKPETDYGPKKKKRKIGRNQLCPCGSGKKYKKCCGKPEIHLLH